jgi:hypothetical protein
MAPTSITFLYPSFFFRTLDENDKSRFHHICHPPCMKWFLIHALSLTPKSIFLQILKGYFKGLSNNNTHYTITFSNIWAYAYVLEEDYSIRCHIKTVKEKVMVMPITTDHDKIYFLLLNTINGRVLKMKHNECRAFKSVNTGTTCKKLSASSLFRDYSFGCR